MDKYNSSGCLDMTAYLALRNAERDEAKAKRKGKVPVQHPNNRQEAPAGRSPRTGRKL